MDKLGKGISEETIYTTAFEAWKFQVDQYWTRSSYYVVFELALAAGIWKVFEEKHWWTSALMSIGAAIFTTLWVLNNERLNEYISYYWKRLHELEETFGIEEKAGIFSIIFHDGQLEKRRYPGSYRRYGRLLPPVFLAGWLWMLAWSALLLYQCGCRGINH
jgi:hypothetical protein